MRTCNAKMRMEYIRLIACPISDSTLLGILERVISICKMLIS